ncbi:hypothetical protein HHI36_001084 [Cryptolaemus montrouzieri]|uniref:Homeotic protein distal-less n=1 Tax=Cryptolaemus montrouzieri TaxID=559131 RepID=A0ABD2P765_9CUCU
MMKAAQVPGGTNNNGTPGGHAGLLGSNANLPSSSPGPQGQGMMQGGGSSSGSPATAGYMQHGSSPAPSSTPGSDMSGHQGGGAPSPGSTGWGDVKPQQPIHPPHHPHPAAPHPHAPPPHNYLPQYSWYPTDNPGLLTVWPAV